MNDINWERLVVVTAVHGEKYLGWIPLTIENPKQYLTDCAQNRLTVQLQDVRNLISQISENQRGVSKVTLLMPIDMVEGPLEHLDVVPSSWYFPGETGGDGHKKKIEDLLEFSVENETRMKAKAVGLHLTSQMPPTAGKP